MLWWNWIVRINGEEDSGCRVCERPGPCHCPACSLEPTYGDANWSLGLLGAPSGPNLWIVGGRTKGLDTCRVSGTEENVSSVTQEESCQWGRVRLSSGIDCPAEGFEVLLGW